MNRTIAGALALGAALTLAATASAQSAAGGASAPTSPPAASTAAPPAPAAPVAQGYPPGSYPAPQQGYPPGSYPAPQQGYPPGGYPPPQPGYYYPPYQPAAPIAPITLPYQEGQPVPEGYHVRTKQRTKLAIAGGAVFGGVYAFNLLIFSAADGNNDADGLYPLLIPVVGPFVTIGTAGANSGATGLLIMDGLAQSAGVAMFIAGLATHTTELVRNDIASLRPSVRVGPGSAELRWRF